MSALAELRRVLTRLAVRRDALVGINRRNVTLVYRHNPRRYYPLADDKLLTKERLAAAGVPTPRTLAQCDGLYAISAALEILAAHDDFVIKPAGASGGAGIIAVVERVAAGRWRTAGGKDIGVAQIQRHLAEVIFGVYAKDIQDRAFIEERILPHPFFDELWNEGLCDVRVLTLESRPLMAMIRVPTRRSQGRANLHQGGLGLAVDLETGHTFRAWSGHDTLRTHPETGAALLGREVPGWRDVLEVATRAAAALPLGYLGVDVVIDRRRGPMVLEVNARPGLEIQNVNGTGLGPALAAVPA
ncbi:MAG: hypothetical protein HY903_05730 [Deltaproteobacteria bacterium]|nr:hypothetical protein [Deltaproteobacteria bacterium]